VHAVSANVGKLLAPVVEHVARHFVVQILTVFVMWLVRVAITLSFRALKVPVAPEQCAMWSVVDSIVAGEWSS